MKFIVLISLVISALISTLVTQDVIVVRSRSSLAVSESFTDADATNLTAHTAERGGPWVKLQETTGDWFINTNRLTKGATASSVAIYATAEPTANCYVQATLIVLSNLGNTALQGRKNPASDNHYFVRYNASDSLWTIRKTVSGVTSQVGTGSYSDPLIANDTRLVRFEMSGSTLTLKIDGTTRITETDTSHSAAGKVGIRYSATAGSSTTGYAWDNFEAGNLP